jgi:hypothetical protein
VHLPPLDDPDSEVAELALVTLSGIGSHCQDERVLPAVASPSEAQGRLREAARLALADRSEEVRYYAASLLDQLGGKVELPAIKKARTAIKAAGWKREFGALIQEINDGASE